MHKWKVRSFTNYNKIYTVTEKDGEFSCNCPYWIYHHKDCKHIKYIKGIYPYYNKEGYPRQEITNLLVGEEDSEIEEIEGNIERREVIRND